jgi:hypothetical protein
MAIRNSSASSKKGDLFSKPQPHATGFWRSMVIVFRHDSLGSIANLESVMELSHEKGIDIMSQKRDNRAWVGVFENSYFSSCRTKGYSRVAGSGQTGVWGNATSSSETRKYWDARRASNVRGCQWGV